MIKQDGKPGIILLAEDDPGDQELTRRALLEGTMENELHVVDDGEELMHYLYRQGKYEGAGDAPRPNLILLDLNMPKIDGRKALEQIRTDPRLRRIAIVVLTTSELEADIIGSYDLGCNSYITKPVSVGEFTRVLLAVIKYWFDLVMLPPAREN